jgi:hypothetical protein
LALLIGALQASLNGQKMLSRHEGLRALLEIERKSPPRQP